MTPHLTLWMSFEAWRTLTFYVLDVIPRVLLVFVAVEAFHTRRARRTLRSLGTSCGEGAALRTRQRRRS